MLANKQDLILEMWLRERNSGTLVWKTKNGDDIPLKNMSDEHIRRCINMLNRQEEEEIIFSEALSSFPEKYY